MKSSRKSQGFTLVEMLLVLMILATLAAIVVPMYAGKIDRANRVAAGTQMQMLATALSAMEVETGRFPATDEGLVALMEPPAGMKGWDGPYVPTLPDGDPWGSPYGYQYPNPENPKYFELVSHGKDMRPGTEDDIVYPVISRATN